jgi:hypothetical protein
MKRWLGNDFSGDIRRWGPRTQRSNGAGGPEGRRVGYSAKRAAGGSTEEAVLDLGVAGDEDAPLHTSTSIGLLSAPAGIGAGVASASTRS